MTECDVFCIFFSQVQHGVRDGHAGQQSTDQPGPLASAGGDSQPAQRHAQRGQRAAHRRRESPRHGRPQPGHSPVHWGSDRGYEGGVRPLTYCTVTRCDEDFHEAHGNPSNQTFQSLAVELYFSS